MGIGYACGTECGRVYVEGRGGRKDVECRERRTGRYRRSHENVGTRMYGPRMNGGTGGYL